MIVNSVNTFRPYRSNATTTNAVKSNSTPAFTANKKSSIPRQSMFRSLNTWVMSLMLGTQLNCSSGNNMTDAQAITPALDATPTPALVDATIPTGAIDTGANCGSFTNNEAAQMLLDELKDAGLVDKSAENLPCQRKYVLFDRENAQAIFNDNLVPISTNSDNVTYTGTISCIGNNIECKSLEGKPFNDSYAIAPNGNLNRELKVNGQTQLKTPMFPKNGLFELVTSGGAQVGDKGETLGYRRAATGGAELCSPEICMPVTFEINGIPVATKLKKAAVRFAEVGKAKLGKVKLGKFADRANAVL